MSDDDIYKRITNPERFAPLPDFVRSLADELSAEYAVERVEDSNNVTLSPTNADAAPLSIEIGDLWVNVRFGRWHHECFPDCMCDGCDMQVDSLMEQLRASVDSLVRGHFVEDFNGDALAYWFENENGRQLVDREHLRAKLGKPARVEWKAWARRAD